MEYTKWRVTKAMSGNWLVFPKSSGGCVARSISSEANAHLIAAAPDLYEELVEADEIICQLCKRLNPQHENCTSCEDRETRLKAILKVEGK